MFSDQLFRSFRPAFQALPFHLSAVAAALLLFANVSASAASLTPEALKEWAAYIDTASNLMQQRLQPGRRFLALDEDSDHLTAIRGGAIYVAPVGEQTPKKVPSGLIHDWFGAAFIPDSKIEDVILTIRDYNRYKEFYHPGVIESKTIATTPTKDRFSLVLMNKTLISKKALDSDGESSYVRVDERRWYSTSRTTRIQEVENYGTPAQRECPEDEGTGLIWRLYSITRFEERDGGVYVELEAMALSRDIPGSLRWAIAPIVRRASRSSLAASLQQTQAAIHPAAPSTSVSADAGLMVQGWRALTQ